MKNTANEYNLLSSVYRQLAREYAAKDSFLSNAYAADAQYVETCAERGERLPSDHLRKIQVMTEAVREADREQYRSLLNKEWEEVQEIREWHKENSHR